MQFIFNFKLWPNISNKIMKFVLDWFRFHLKIHEGSINIKIHSATHSQLIFLLVIILSYYHKGRVKKKKKIMEFSKRDAFRFWLRFHNFFFIFKHGTPPVRIFHKRLFVSRGCSTDNGHPYMYGLSCIGR